MEELFVDDSLHLPANRVRKHRTVASLYKFEGKVAVQEGGRQPTFAGAGGIGEGGEEEREKGAPEPAEKKELRPRMDRLLGLLRVKVLRGVHLAVRDLRTSDPYIILKLGKQKLKTRVIRKNVNPEWNEDLTLTIEDPDQPVKLEVYDKDTFSFDDPMGNAEFDIQPFVEAVKMSYEGVANNTIIRKVMPCRNNCLADESKIYLRNGKVVQDIILRLKDVECGEVELQLQWIHVPNSRGV